MPQPNDLSRSLVALDQNSTIIAVVELSHSSWLVGGLFRALNVSRAKSWSRTQNDCLLCCIAGGMRRSRPAARSPGLRLPSKPDATASGWRVGLRRVASRRM